MRTPDDLPRRRRTPGRSLVSGRRGRILLGAGLVALLILILSLRGIASFYTDYLWFSSLEQTGVWSGLVGARVFLAVLFILLFFVIAWVNFFVADKLAPPFRPAGPEDELLERYHEVVAGRMQWVRLGVAGFLAFIAGIGASGEWNSWILFRNGGSFGMDDPQFGYDVGFYVFSLPFLSFVVDWLFASLLIILIITAVAHYLNGGIRVQTQGPRVTPQVKAHLSLLLAALAVVKGVDYFFQRMELTFSSRGVVDGATYTDVNAQLPALNLLMLISVAAAALFVVNIFRRGWTLPVVAVALWGFVAIVVGGIYPAYVQRFQVEPNESARESEYIERNMEATRFALDVDDVDVRSFEPNTAPPTEVDLTDYESTIRNIRLWDPSERVSLRTYEQLQRIRDYYQISDIDVDRYVIDGELTAVGLGLRTIDGGRVPIGGWEGRHLAYTHGYGAVLAPTGGITSDREPDFLLEDVPLADIDVEGLSMPQPRVYFGEDLTGYIMVGTDRDEIDYATAEDTVVTPYEGEDGVEAGSLLRRTAFALRFGDINPIISGFVGSSSRMIYLRDIQERISELAPFLHADNDPYPVLLEDRTVWVQDLYTTTDRFPYAQAANVDELPADSGLRHDFNYVRNSVKAVVDAYDGTVSFYVMDEEDPIVDAYRSAFPDLFSDADELDEDLPGLREHLRYPEDIFRTQTTAWQRYHLQDVDDFYNRDDAWTVARDPGTVGAEGVTPVTDASGEVTEVRDARMSPYYQLLQLPGEEGIEFSLMRSFVPFSEDDQRQQLRSFMAARMSPENYGELVVYEMPQDDLPAGPGIVAADIRSDSTVARLETLLGESGSTVLFGNLLLLPMDDALVYVQPFYVEPQDRRLPRLTRVIVAYEENVVIATTLQEALADMFGEQVETAEDPDIVGEDDLEGLIEEDEAGEIPESDAPAEEDTGDGEGQQDGDQQDGEQPPDLPEGSTSEQVAALLDEAEQLMDEADQAWEDRDLGTYQQRVEEARERVQQAIDLATEEAQSA